MIHPFIPLGRGMPGYVGHMIPIWNTEDNLQVCLAGGIDNIALIDGTLSGDVILETITSEIRPRAFESPRRIHLLCGRSKMLVAYCGENLRFSDAYQDFLKMQSAVNNLPEKRMRELWAHIENRLDRDYRDYKLT